MSLDCIRCVDTIHSKTSADQLQNPWSKTNIPPSRTVWFPRRPFSIFIEYLASNLWSQSFSPTFSKRNFKKRKQISHLFLVNVNNKTEAFPLPSEIPARKNRCHNCFHVKINFSDSNGGVRSCTKFSSSPILSSSSVLSKRDLKRSLLCPLRGMRKCLITEANSFDRLFRNTFQPHRMEECRGMIVNTNVLRNPALNWI